MAIKQSLITILRLRKFSKMNYQFITFIPLPIELLLISGLFIYLLLLSIASVN